MVSDGFCALEGGSSGRGRLGKLRSGSVNSRFFCAAFCPFFPALRCCFLCVCHRSTFTGLPHCSQVRTCFLRTGTAVFRGVGTDLVAAFCVPATPRIRSEGIRGFASERFV